MAKTKTFSDFYSDESVDFPLLSYLSYIFSGDRKQDRQYDLNQEAFEQQAATTFDYQKKAASEMPSLQLQGFQDAGISAGAAAAALTGGASVQSPSFSSAGSSSVTQPDAMSLLAGLIPQAIQAKLVDAQVNNLDTDSDIKEKRFDLDATFTAEQIKEIKSRIDKNAHDMHLSDRQQNVAERLANASIGKTHAEVAKMKSEIKSINADILKTMSETTLIDRQAMHELIKMSLTKAQTNAANAAATQSITASQLNTQLVYESEARQGNIEAQTQGQYLANDQQEMLNYLKRKRVEVSQLLGFEVDADETTMVLEAMVDGDVEAALQALGASENGVVGAVYKGISSFKNRRSFRDRGGTYSTDRRSGHRIFWHPYYRDTN